MAGRYIHNLTIVVFPFALMEVLDTPRTPAAAVLQVLAVQAAAVGVAVARRGLAGDANRIVMDGGAVTIDWDRETTHVTMTGPVAYVCEGSLSAGLAGFLEAGDVRP